LPFINGGPIDQVVDIDVLHQKSGPIDQSDQLINGAQQIQSILLWKTEDIESGEYINGETNFRAFWRTLIGDSRGFIRATDFGSDFLQGLGEQFHMVFENCSDPLNPVLQKVNKRLRLNVHQTICCLKFVRILSSYTALVPHASEVGNEICMLLGSSTPMVMRRELRPSPTIEGSPASNSIHEEARAVHQTIGLCYVHGVMDGEMIGGISESFVITWFLLNCAFQSTSYTKHFSLKKKGSYVERHGRSWKHERSSMSLGKGIAFKRAVDSISENRRWFLGARIGLSATRMVAVGGREKKTWKPREVLISFLGLLWVGLLWW
jgi:hypothetical protein